MRYLFTPRAHGASANRQFYVVTKKTRMTLIAGHTSAKNAAPE